MNERQSVTRDYGVFRTVRAHARTRVLVTKLNRKPISRRVPVGFDPSLAVVTADAPQSLLPSQERGGHDSLLAGCTCHVRGTACREFSDPTRAHARAGVRKLGMIRR